MKKKLILILFLFPLMIFAQDSLSISDALQIGLKKNFDILISKNKVKMDSIYNNWGEAGRYPSVDIGASQNNNLSDQSQNPTSFIQTLLKSNSYSSNISLNWTIFNGFNVRANKIKLEQLLELSEGSVTLLIENTIHGIILSYYQVKLQREQLTLLKNILNLSREKFEFQKTKNELGLGVTVDLLQFENAYLQDSSNLILQELAYKNSIRNLNLIMGIDIEKKWKLTTAIIPPDNLYNYDDLKQKMLASNTNIKNQLLNISLLKQDITIAKSVFYPVISFNSGAGYNNSRYKIGNYDPIAGSNLNYYGNFTLNFRIFDGGKVRRGLQALKVQEEVNELEKNQLELQLTQELSTIYDTYQTRLRIFEINKLSFQVAKKNFQIAQLKENSGLINSFNLRDIEMAYLSAGIALFQSSFNLIESNSSLTKLTGGIIQDYDTN